MWTQRVKESIKFESPSGSVFTALWVGNERSFEKKLGVFDAPNFDGAIIQDLGIGSDSYPLTIYFEGINHDKDAEAFYNALSSDRGPWIVDHPTKGKKRLQLVSCSEAIQPVENGNNTVFEMSWLRPGNVEEIATSDNLFSKIISAVNAVQSAAVLAQQARSDLYSNIQSAINTYNRIAGLGDTILAEIAATNAILLDAYESARSALTGAIDNFDPSKPDFTEINEAIYDLISAPADLDDFSQSFSMYDDFLESAIALPNTTIDAAATKEFSLIMLFLALAESTLAATFETRSEIVVALERLTDFYNELLHALDGMQSEYNTGTINSQYFPQTENYQDIYNLYADAIRYLLLQFFNLSAEKRFFTDRGRSPIEITVTEYGTLGEDDENYNLFIRSNKLTGNEILLLPPGREVVIYV